jgi:Fe-S-cluster-containing hydrogenase component 2
MEKYLMAIPNRCTGCNRCVLACSVAKEGVFMPSKARIHVSNIPHQGYSVPNVCFQCPAADCLKACPQEAILKSHRNVIVVDANKCNGCGDCVAACTYGMIEQYASGKAYKCDLCGGAPACVAECHFGALVFKQVDKISGDCRKEQMKQRVKEGSPADKRHQIAHDLLDRAVRVPRTVGYMG